MGNCGIHIYSNLEDEIINFQGYFVTHVSSGIASRRCFASCGSVLLPLRAVAEKEGPLHSPSILTAMALSTYVTACTLHWWSKGCLSLLNPLSIKAKLPF